MLDKENELNMYTVNITNISLSYECNWSVRAQQDCHKPKVVRATIPRFGFLNGEICALVYPFKK